ncbi:MAG: hypothetical protein AB8B53_01810 [Flavobacteriales bacterium]
MKRLILLIVVSLFLQDTFAQLSTRENNDFTPKLGTRPSAGDAVLQFSFPVINLTGDNEAGLYAGRAFTAGDMLTFKYYQTDELVFRAGLRLASQNMRTNGTAVDSTNFNPLFNEDFAVETNRKVMTTREYNIAGGVEKHFTNDNILDVYAGGEALFGFGRDRTVSEEALFNGDVVNVETSTRTTVVGVGGVVGFNVFIAELPVSLGVEYGLSAKWVFGGKTKVNEEIDIDGGASYDAEYFTQETDGFGDIDTNQNGNLRRYSDLSRRAFNMDTNNMVRINLNIYFGTRSNK